MIKAKIYDNSAIIEMIESIPHNLTLLEKELGMPKTMLSKVMREERGMPKHWRLALIDFVEKYKKEKSAKLG